MPLILGTNSIKDTGFDVDNSLRFNDGSSDYLNATNGTPTDNDKCTLSVWVKRSALGGTKAIIGFHTDDNNRGNFVFDSDKIEVRIFDSGSTTTQLTTTQVFRDVSAWYHIVLSVDTGQGTAASRVRLYVNGSEVTVFGTETNPSQNLNFGLNNNSVVLKIGQKGENNDYYDGYMSEVCFIDGLQLAPTSFGEFDDSGIWKPLDVSGLTFGDNGFYLEFKQAGTGTNASGMGADTSGNTNHFAVNNLTAVDQSTDTCTNNFATLNPLFAPLAGTPVYSDGNLTSISDGAANENGWAGATTIGVSSGKWYCEGKCTLGGDYSRGSIGVTYDPSQSAYKNGGNNPSGKFAYGWTYRSYDGVLLHNNSTVWDGNTFTTGDIIGVYIDLDNHKLYISKNGTLENSGTGADLTTGETYHIFNEDVTGTSSTSKFEFNFGSPSYAISSSNSDPNGYGSFEYSTTITGDSASKAFYAINTKNLAEFG